MMKIKLIISIIVLMFTSQMYVNAQEKTLYDFEVETIDGEVFDMAKLKGKKVLIVNVASKCGLTPQYEKLQALYDKYKEDDFVIIGFPANNFNGQEPGTNEEIAEFCSLNYGVDFPIMSKISVKGDDIAPIYSWLTSKEQNGVMDVVVEWNFQKFLIDADGKLVKTVKPRTDPMSDEIVNWIEE